MITVTLKKQNGMGLSIVAAKVGLSRDRRLGAAEVSRFVSGAGPVVLGVEPCARAPVAEGWPPHGKWSEGHLEVTQMVLRRKLSKRWQKWVATVGRRPGTGNSHHSVA